MGIMEIYNLRNSISPKVIVSYGNQIDVDPSDLVQYFDDDPMVDAIGLYIEGFCRAGRTFFEVMREAASPSWSTRPGRTEAGCLGDAVAHREHEVAKAAMRQWG